MDIDATKLDDFMGRFVQDLGAVMHAATIVVGDRLGLYKALARDGRRVSFALHEATGEDEWLVVLTESNDRATIEALGLAFRLTTREAEVLHWVVQGKTNRDIGDILGTSPRTVHKHLEHVFAKLGVETRTAAAMRALA